MAKIFALALAAFFLNSSAFAAGQYVDLPSGHKVFAEYEAAAQGKPTVVLINGLVYDLNRWDKMVEPMKAQGFGIVRYFFRGQMETLRGELNKDGKAPFFAQGFSREDMAIELSQLLDALKVQGKVNVVGLSYGSAIAAEFGSLYPNRVDHLFFLSPLVISLDHYDVGGAWLNWNLEALKKLWGPFWGPYVYDQYYNWIYRSYMRDRLVVDRIPERMMDITDAYKEALFHQVRAVRDFDLRTYKFPGLEGRVHLMLAASEIEPAIKDQFHVWENLGAAQGSLTYFSPSWHAIPDAIGAWAGEVTAGLIQKDGKLPQLSYSHPEKSWEGVEPMEYDALKARALSEPREKY